MQFHAAEGNTEIYVHRSSDLSEVDASEAEKVSLFFANGCGCKLGPKNASC